MNTASPRPDLPIYNAILRMERYEVIDRLVQILGKTFTAYLADVKDTRTIESWRDSAYNHEESRRLTDDRFQRLTLALRIAMLLATHDSARVVQGWFGGSNPQLNDQNPARLLRDGDAADGEAVLNAARAFLVGG